VRSKKGLYICIDNNSNPLKLKLMEHLITAQESIIDAIEYRIDLSLDREEIAMYKRAHQEAMTLLTTLRYINQ